MLYFLIVVSYYTIDAKGKCEQQPFSAANLRIIFDNYKEKQKIKWGIQMIKLESRLNVTKSVINYKDSNCPYRILLLLSVNSKSLQYK